MSKIKSFYCNDVDKVWYDSSNVLYSECDDITDGLKVLRVTFKNGRTYQYYDVNVHDYLLFRENASQGVALNKFIKQYRCERIDDLNVDDIQSELEKLNASESLKTKNDLFEKLDNIYESIISVRENLKNYDLNNNELLPFYINTSISPYGISGIMIDKDNNPITESCYINVTTGDFILHKYKQQANYYKYNEVTKFPIENELFMTIRWGYSDTKDSNTNLYNSIPLTKLNVNDIKYQKYINTVNDILN